MLPLQLGLERDSFDLKNPRRAIVQDRAFRRKPLRGTGLFRQRGNLQGIGEPVLASPRFFLNSQASGPRERPGAFTMFTFSSSTALSTPASTALRSRLRAHLATSPA